MVSTTNNTLIPFSLLVIIYTNSTNSTNTNINLPKNNLNLSLCTGDRITPVPCILRPVRPEQRPDALRRFSSRLLRVRGAKQAAPRLHGILSLQHERVDGFRAHPRGELLIERAFLMFLVEFSRDIKRQSYFLLLHNNKAGVLDPF